MKKILFVTVFTSLLVCFSIEFGAQETTKELPPRPPIPAPINATGQTLDDAKITPAVPADKAEKDKAVAELEKRLAALETRAVPLTSTMTSAEALQKQIADYKAVVEINKKQSSAACFAIKAHFEIFINNVTGAVETGCRVILTK